MLPQTHQILLLEAKIEDLEGEISYYERKTKRLESEKQLAEDKLKIQTNYFERGYILTVQSIAEEFEKNILSEIEELKDIIELASGIEKKFFIRHIDKIQQIISETIKEIKNPMQYHK